MATFVDSKWDQHIKDLLSVSIEVCITSAYMDLGGLKMLKRTLNDLPNKGRLRFNFLLSKDFHDNPLARDAIINELLEFPHSEVRVYEEPDEFLHSKLYIFYMGNEANVLVGSANATRAGWTKNLETGLLSTDRKVKKDAEAFFNRCWRKSRVAVYKEGVVYKNQKFKPGERVKRIDNGEVGVITFKKAIFKNDEWHYEVIFGSNARVCVESNLVAYHIVSLLNTNEFFDELLSRTSLIEFKKLLLLNKLGEASRYNLFSFQSSRTESKYYQFIPLMKMLNSAYDRLMIADEVGLGKTIEAGIIISEYKVRYPDINKILIVCPKALQKKWQKEMEIRFEQYFEILDKNSLNTFFKSYRENSDKTQLFGIVTYSLIRRKEMIDKIDNSDISLDLVIFDEAHHLKNEKTLMHKMAQILSLQSSKVLMLTATPIQLGRLDLYQLLKILVPKVFKAMGEVDFIDYIAPNRCLVECIELLDQGKHSDIMEHIESNILKHRSWREMYSNNPILKELQMLSVKADISIEEKGAIRKALYDLNTLNSFITRTRKSDVGEFNQREVTTIEYDYTSQEEALYNMVLEVCRVRFMSKKNQNSAFLYIMPERQASSCLPSTLKKYQNYSSENEDINNGVDMIEEEFEDEVLVGEKDNYTKLVGELNRKIQKFTLQIDSKYEKFKEYILSIAMEENQTPKMLIFSFFKDTIRYLHEKLNEDFGNGDEVALTLHGDSGDNDTREEIKNRFEKDSSIRFLVCSEVASEGLDFQFCHRLVNYDLPWNPMKLEQRIGRIDRHGQEADKIFVVNFVCRQTIEDRIFSRLIERVQVYRNSLGPIAEILGELKREFTLEMLKPSKTPEEIKNYEEKINENFRLGLREQKKIYSNKESLVGLDDYFMGQLTSLTNGRKYFTSSEIKEIIKIYLQDECSSSYLREIKPDVYQLYLGAKYRDLVIQFLYGEQNMRKKNKFLNILQSKDEILCTFEQSKAKNLSYEYLTIHHPFIKAILNNWDKMVYPRTNCLRLENTNLSSGRYLLISIYIKYEGLTGDPNVFMLNIAVDINSNQIKEELGDKLYHLLISEQSQEVMVESLNIDEERISEIVSQYTNQRLSDLEIELKQNIQKSSEQQINSLEGTFQKELGLLKHRQSKTFDKYKKQEIEQEMDKLKENFDVEKIKLKQGNHLHLYSNIISMAYIEV